MRSPIDDLFDSIFGFTPKKAGASYEMLVAAVCKLLSEQSEVLHDQRITGLFSRHPYQADILLHERGLLTIAEAKDYAGSCKPVGRPDVQKLGGALGDLPVADAKFFSATRYTAPAREYAAAAKHITGRSINLVQLRPSTTGDEKCRITEIHLALTVLIGDFERATFTPVWRKAGITTLKDLARSACLGDTIRIETIYNQDNSTQDTIAEMVKGIASDESNVAWGSFFTPHGYLNVSGTLVPITGITYEVHFYPITREVVVSLDGTAKVLVRSEDGSINKLITDADLKRITFGPGGEVSIAARR